jgi:hypothetical protein
MAWLVLIALQDDDAMIARLADADERVRQASEKALCERGVKALAALRRQAHRRPEARAVAAAIEEKVRPLIPKLIADLGDEDFAVRERAHETLTMIGEPALPALRERAHGDDPEVQARARHIIRLIRTGPWLQSMEDYCRANGLPVDGLREIEPDRVARFHPDVRFFEAPGQEAGNHYRVESDGRVAAIASSTGGDITDMFGDGRPKLDPDRDVRDYLILVVSLRYGFDDLDRGALTVEPAGEGAWGMKASSRYFTLTVDGERRPASIHMR